MRAATIEEFAGGPPVDRYVRGRNWLYFRAHEGFAGFVAWERVTVDDLLALGPILKIMHSGGAARYGALIDLRRVSSVDEAVFEVTASYAKRFHQRLQAAVARVAIVRVTGFLGAIAGGYFDVVPRPYPVGVFSDPAEALTWLGCTSDLAVLAEIDAIVTQASGGFLQSLRELLDQTREKRNLESAARHLGMAPRTLQRRLREEGSSFQAELAGARLRAAQRLMLESDAPLTEIAFNAGFASPAHLSTQFRKVIGEAPSSWRARHRA